MQPASITWIIDVNIDKDSGPVLVFRDIGPDEPARRDHGDQSWIDHCRRRERAERTAAKTAASEHARRVHQELAQAYVRIIDRAERRSKNRSDGGSPSEPWDGVAS